MAPKEQKSLSNYLLLTLRLLAHMRRRLLRLKAAKNQDQPPMPAEMPADAGVAMAEGENNTGWGIEVISEGVDGNFAMDRDWVPALQKAVKMIHFGSWEEKEAAAGEMERLAAEGLRRRRAMAELGVIPPLVAMVGSEVAARRGLAVRALIELGNGSYTNNALMVEAGILSKLPKNVNALEEDSKREFGLLLLSISALANTKFSVNSSKIIPAVISILESSSFTETKKVCLSALFNLSSILENVGHLISNDIVDHLINLLATKETAEKALAVLGNLVVTLAGKRSIERNPAVPGQFIEITTWEENPKCQESSAYILMVLAHENPLQRQKMAEAGIVQVLLGLALLGSPLGQKRALKILQWFKDERQMRVGAHSGPQIGRAVVGFPVDERRGAEEGKVLMRKIVKESLHKNLEKITSRAKNGDEDGLKLKALVVSSSSKSLPY